mgnify:CR=1 FL=1
MTKKTNSTIYTNGTSVRNREQQALHYHYVGIDERSLSDLMAFTNHFAHYVPYTNLDNDINGNWSPFFEKNLAFLLAEVARTDLDELNERFKGEIKSLDRYIDEEELANKLTQLIIQTREAFDMVDGWFKRSRVDLVHLEENRLAENLRNAIKLKLSAEFTTFLALLEHFRELGLIKESFYFSQFDQLWTVDAEKQERTVLIAEITSYAQAFSAVSKVHKSTFSVITYLQSIASTLLNDVLENYPYHSPHISLYLSFLKLFQHVQGDLNKITHRHLDYYYKDVLEQSLRPSVPDSVHIFLQPGDHIIKEQIPANTLLIAGTDEDGLDYTYETTHPLELNLGRITDLKVLHVASNPLIGLGSPYRSVSNIYSRTVLLDDAGFALDEYHNQEAFDSFGKDQSEISMVNRTMQEASVGFAITSSVLLLKEGKRSINIRYKFSLRSMSSLILFIEAMVKNNSRAKQEDGVAWEENSKTPLSVFNQIFRNIFRVRLTTTDGWFETDAYEVQPSESWTNGEIYISLLLDISDPEVTGYQEEIHGEGFETKWPVASFELTSEHAMYAYSYLRDLMIEKCTIDVKVEKLKNLIVYNDLGLLDIHKPFTPFGATQEVGSYFVVGNEEIFRKRVTDLSLDIQWHNLPRLKGGLQAYYKEYKEDVVSDDFKVAVRGLSEFEYYPQEVDDAEVASLFRIDAEEDILLENSRIEGLEIGKLQLKPNFKDEEFGDYSSQTRSGFLKFEITEPAMGFGQSEYPRLFSETVMHNSKVSMGILSKGPKNPLELPNEPLIPQIRSISMDYEASVTINMHENDLAENDQKSGDKIYHLYPFGKRKVFENGLPIKSQLLPQFNNEGYLYIGLEGLQPPVELSFYIELINKVDNRSIHTDIPQIKWKYLVNNSWERFSEQDFISDSTNNFITSGIIRLKVPARINTEHEILDSGKFWLSASVGKNTEMLSQIALIQTNGIRAKWTPHKPDEHWQMPLEANTISSFVETRPEVSGIVQPFPSFGGRIQETVEEFYIRVSERLKHKNRCIVPEDFEKLILHHYSDLFQVKCLTSFSHPDDVATPGHMKVVVVPKLKYQNEFYQPKVGYDQLEEIAAFVRKKASPFAVIEVMNPVYEKIRISCKIRLRDNEMSGEYIKQIENDLRKYLCPWFGNEQQEMVFGGSIERDDILSYLESLDYVRFVTKLSVIVIHSHDGKYSMSDSARDRGKVNELISTAPWSVLIADSHHDIELIDRSISEYPEETRISTMKIGTDFIIMEEEEQELEFPMFNIDDDTYYMIDLEL